MMTRAPQATDTKPRPTLPFIDPKARRRRIADRREAAVLGVVGHGDAAPVPSFTFAPGSATGGG